MWLEQVNEFSEIFRFSLPYYIAVLLPILIILSPAEAATEFPVYRLQHFDLQGVKYGKKFSCSSASYKQRKDIMMIKFLFCVIRIKKFNSQF